LKLRIADELPDGFVDAPPEDLLGVLGGPTLIRLPGSRPDPLFVSILLHGNETTGLSAVQDVLRRHQARQLPRAFWVFVANVEAAKERVRRLPSQADFNRVWPGSDAPDGPEARLMREVIAALRERPPFASVDIHNNSGMHPFYACVTNTELESLRLATLFSRIVIHFLQPRGVATAALAALGPAVTIECGRSGEWVEHTAQCLDAVLHLTDFPRHPLVHGDVDLFHTVATVKVPPEVSLSFDGSVADIAFRDDLDHLNFSELPPGTRLAQVRRGGDLLVVSGDDGRNRWREVFDVRGDALVLQREVIPSMLTRSVEAVRLDCLCYLMERMAPDP
jgi:hypothetical protein